MTTLSTSLLRTSRLLSSLLAAIILAACTGNNSPTNTSSKASPAAEIIAEKITVNDGKGGTRQAAASADAYVQPKDSGAEKTTAFNPQLRSNRPITTQINLGAANAEKRQVATQKQGHREEGKALQVSFPREVLQAKTSTSTSQLLQWSPTTSGGNIAAINYQSLGAQGMRIGVAIQSLPAQAILRFYSPTDTQANVVTGQAINELIALNIKSGDTSEDARTYWGAFVAGENATIEIELPKGTSPQSVAIATPRVSHFFLNPLSKQALTEGENASPRAADTCNNDIVCNIPASTASNAVAKMAFIVGGSGYVCTGTLLNDTASSGTPYFLSANHCIASQTVASTLITYWFYKSSACNNGILNPSYVTKTGGATYLWGRSAASGFNGAAPIGTDTSFMRLIDTPPAGAVFAGWTAIAWSPTNSSTVTGVHHPDGDLQKYSTGSITNYGYLYNNAPYYSPNNSSNGLGMYRNVWSSGITEGGSSGSGLFLNGNTTNPKLIGQLWGGYSYCATPTAPDYYGRFDIAFQDGLAQWLDPGYSSIFRFFHNPSQSYFFTNSLIERNSIITNYPQFFHEGVQFSARSVPTNGLSPVYRFRNKINGSYFWTISDAEKSNILNNYTHQFVYENIGWYASSTAMTGWIPLYRFRDVNNTYFFTASETERQSLAVNYATRFIPEGIAYYVRP